MIKFFRHIRRSLINQNKMGKYFKYAFGEIILVVIGILIALSINNWNENRKSEKQELILMKQLQTDIISNKNEVKELSKRLRINKIGIDSLISKLTNQNNDLTVPIYLAQTMRKVDFNSAQSGYNIMQSGKASLISDEQVLKTVLNLYENDLADIMDRQTDMNNSIDYIQKHFINKLFVQAQNNLNIKFKELDVIATEAFEPINFDALAENIEFKNTLFQLGKLVETRLAFLSNTEKELDRTLDVLEFKIEQ